MAKQNQWTRDQTVAVLHVYLQLPFGQLHQRHPLIRAFAGWIGRTPGAVAMKLSNIASLDRNITSTGRVGLKDASGRDREVWAWRDCKYSRVTTQHAALAGFGTNDC